jgi:16S rRNA (guanine527-N7)-methyltransferase
MTTSALADAIGCDVSRETVEKLELLQAMVVAEASQQNLVSAATLDDFWLRHIVDSAQLLRYGNGTPWLDLGTGAGFPGLVIAILAQGPVVLCEERRLRYTFLQSVADTLALENVRICGMKLERLENFPAATISARAFAPLERLLTLAHRFSTEKTRWVLPKGRNAQQEVESVRRTWHGDFRLEPSVTDPDSHIIVAQGIRPRTSR